MESAFDKKRGKMMETHTISITNNLRNERMDGWDQMMIPRHADVPRTSYLNARNLTINMSGIGKERNRPNMQEMLARIWQ